jgi:hypothetical protein
LRARESVRSETTVEKQSLFAEAAMQRLDASIGLTRATIAHRDGVLSAYERLLHCVRSRTGILSRRAHRKGGLDVNKALLAMALSHSDWLRPVEGYRGADSGAFSELASLAAHLFTRYPVPRFLSSAWLDGEACEITPTQSWYKALGLGHSLRRIGIPMPITKAMAHRFMRAPNHLTVISALRWAQVHALGGDESLARIVIETRLGRALENEEFWQSVVQFFVRYPELGAKHSGPIVDLLQHQKFECREGVLADGRFGLQPPPHPDLTMKGRTPAALVRQVELWHVELGTRKARSCSWPRAPMHGFRWVEKGGSPRSGEEADPDGESRLWTVSELCTSDALFLEGKAMRHCVATYVADCQRRRTSIWSMQLETRRGRRRVMTIEVELTSRAIVQARRKFNALPRASEMDVLSMWALCEGLELRQTLR